MARKIVKRFRISKDFVHFRLFFGVQGFKKVCYSTCLITGAIKQKVASKPLSGFEVEKNDFLEKARDRQKRLEQRVHLEDSSMSQHPYWLLIYRMYSFTKEEMAIFIYKLESCKRPSKMSALIRSINDLFNMNKLVIDFADTPLPSSSLGWLEAVNSLVASFMMLVSKFLLNSSFDEYRRHFYSNFNCSGRDMLKSFKLEKKLKKLELLYLNRWIFLFILLCSCLIRKFCYHFDGAYNKSHVIEFSASQGYNKVEIVPNQSILHPFRSNSKCRRDLLNGAGALISLEHLANTMGVGGVRAHRLHDIAVLPVTEFRHTVMYRFIQ